MKTKIFENARFCPKGDIEANWNKAVGFIPLDKEIIIYKADAEHPVARFKIGDGKTVVQDLPFAGADMIAIKQLMDEKGELLVEYVDNAIASINIPEQIQVDYNQNDETASDYIKNRPFYEEYEEYEGVFVDNSNITDIQQENSVAGYTFNKTFSEQDLLTITINGEIYPNLSCGSIQGDLYLYGNLSLAGLGDDTGEPFCIVINLSDKTIAVMQTISSTYDWQDFKITKIESGFIVKKKLDVKFVPDEIATKDYVYNFIQVASNDLILTIF